MSVKQTSGVGAQGTAMGMLTGALIGLLAGPARSHNRRIAWRLTGMLVDLNKAGVDVRLSIRSATSCNRAGRGDR